MTETQVKRIIIDTLREILDRGEWYGEEGENAFDGFKNGIDRTEIELRMDEDNEKQALG